jgi:hypothetical protein
MLNDNRICCSAYVKSGTSFERRTNVEGIWKQDAVENIGTRHRK